MQFETEAKQYTDPEKMAAAYLVKYYGNQRIEYPINPFKMLNDEGILFYLMDFKKLEGVYIPASSSGDVPVIGINVNRPITRQRFSAAHELCHHFRIFAMLIGRYHVPLVLRMQWKGSRKGLQQLC